VILVSHRGNINGKLPERENSPDYILEAIESGYHVEVDVWYKSGRLYLGHDSPEYETSISFLENDKMWCHCKNIEALARLVESDVHCFFHQTDEVTLTSRGYMWVYPNKKLVKGSVCVLPELANYAEEDLEKCIGVCSDYVEDYKDL
tara:strand:+ start:767 stop:1207 length:441 start_codon:yes stop_codon:yes gene_type:complete